MMPMLLEAKARLLRVDLLTKARKVENRLVNLPTLLPLSQGLKLSQKLQLQLEKALEHMETTIMVANTCLTATWRP